MSISMDRFGTDGQFAKFDAHAGLQQRVSMFQLQCRACGFEPEDVVTPPRLCPKCHGKSWERYARPGSILDNALRS
jgi:predicted Zn-ribbon and HTH transcriptional regulator